MKKNVRFMCACAMIAVISSQNFLIGMMEESGEFDTGDVQQSKSNVTPVPVSYEILNAQAQEKVRFAQQKIQTLPLTAENLAQHNKSQTNTPKNSTATTPSQTSSLGIQIPVATDINQLDLSSTSSQSGSVNSDTGLPPKTYNPSELDINSQILSQSNSQSSNLGSSDSRSTISSGSSSSKSNSSTMYSTKDPNGPNIDTTNLVDVSIENSTPTTNAPQNNSFPTGLQFAINASDAASRARSAISNAANNAGKSISSVASAAGTMLPKIPTINLPTVSQLTTNASDAASRAGSAISNAANNAGEVMYDTATHVGNAMYTAAGNVGTALQTASKTISKSVSPQQSQTEQLNPLEEHTENGIPEASTNKQPSTLQNLYNATAAKIFTMNWFQFNNISAASVTPAQKSYISRIIEFATTNLNPIKGAQYLSDQFTKLFSTKPATKNPLANDPASFHNPDNLGLGQSSNLDAGINNNNYDNANNGLTNVDKNSLSI